LRFRYRGSRHESAVAQLFSLGHIEHFMPKKRSSVRHAQFRGALERSFERKARDFAFETGFDIDVRGSEVFIGKDGQMELLCVAEDPKHFWRTTWQAMAADFPALKRYLF
jgi:hypothetical protein